MGIELDHVFVCTSAGAPEASELVRFGLHEGPANQHPGQGTANRRFAFENGMLELLWVNSEEEARAEETRRTQLWERWSGRDTSVCPFGICLRPTGVRTSELPFPAWEYRPSYLPDPLSMHIAEAGVEEPMWVYLDFLTRAQREQHFANQPVGIREITGLALTCPFPLRSPASRVVQDAGVLTTRPGPSWLLEIEFNHGQQSKVADFRANLPLVFTF